MYTVRCSGGLAEAYLKFTKTSYPTTTNGKKEKKRDMTFDLDCFSTISFCSQSCETTL